MDLRVEKTERAVRNAFLELRSKTPVEKIKVRELCEKAMINKSTFYAHYNDIYDLSDTMETETVIDIIKGIPNPTSVLEQPVEFAQNLAIAFISQLTIINVLFGGSERNHLADKIEAAIKKIVCDTYPEFANDIRRNLLLSYCIHGSYNIVMHHTELPMQTLVDEIREITTLLEPLYHEPEEEKKETN